MALIQQKKLVEGIAELERAYEIFPHPNVAYNVATAQAEMGHYELAIGAYRTYLDSNPPDRVEVDKAIQDLTAKLAAQRAEKAAEEAKPPEAKPADKPPEVKPGEKPPELKPGEKPPEAKPTDKPPEVKPGEPSPAVVVEKPGEVAAQARKEDVYEQTVVTASRGAQSPLDAPNSTTIITKQDIRLSGMTRIPELLRRVAGMDVMQITGGEEDVSMRGFNGRQANKLLVLVDGRLGEQRLPGLHVLGDDHRRRRPDRAHRSDPRPRFGPLRRRRVRRRRQHHHDRARRGEDGLPRRRRRRQHDLRLGLDERPRGRLRVPRLRGLHALPAVDARDQPQPHRPERRHHRRPEPRGGEPARRHPRHVPHRQEQPDRLRRRLLAQRARHLRHRALQRLQPGRRQLGRQRRLQGQVRQRARVLRPPRAASRARTTSTPATRSTSRTRSRTSSTSRRST